MAVMPMIVGALGTLSKGLEKGLEELEIRGRIDILLISALLRSARILRRVLETWGDLLLLRPQEKTIS